MSENTSFLLMLLRQAFENVGEQLDRIIDAYGRKSPPFVPTSFPVYLKINTAPETNYSGIYKLNSDFTYETISGYSPMASYYVEDGIYFFEDAVSVKFDSNFNIVEVKGYNDHYVHTQDSTAEWVDPSTLS